MSFDNISCFSDVSPEERSLVIGISEEILTFAQIF